MNGRNDSSSRGTPRRTEPVLGNLDQLDASTDRRDKRSGASQPPPFRAREAREPPPRRSHRGWWFALVVLLVLVGAGAWAFTHQTMLRGLDRKSTRLNSSHPSISYAVFCLKKKSI